MNGFKNGFKSTAANKIFLLLIILAFISTTYVIFQQNRYLTAANIIKKLDYKHTLDHFDEVLTKENNYSLRTYFILTYKEQQQVQAFDIKNNEIITLPKTSLNGIQQKYISCLYPYNAFVKVNAVKSSDKDSIGIEIYDTKKQKWHKLKTKILPRDSKNAYSAQIVYFDRNVPLLLIWGDIDNKKENMLEVIDIMNDKLLQKISFNYTGGKFIIVDYINLYFINGKPNKNLKTETIQILNRKFKILPYIGDNVVTHLYTKSIDRGFLSSSGMPTILAGDLNQNKLIEYELITNQNKSVKMNEIPVPKKYASYKLINVIIKAGKYIVLVFKNDNEQVLVRLKPYSKIKSKNQDYRFEKLAKINPDIDLSKAEYIHSDKLEEYKLVIFTEHEIKELELKI